MKLSRRMFLRSATGAAIALPLLGDVPGARAQTAAPIKRLIVMFSPNGTIPSAWASTGQGASFAPGPIFSELVAAGHKNDLIVFQGLDMSACLDGPGGDAHGLGIGCMLTGTELAAGELFQAGMGGAGSGWPGGISVDQFIASKLPQRPHLSIDFTIKRMSGSIWSRMSYTGPNGQVVEPFDDPSVAFNTLFAGVGDSTATVARRNARRKSVLDGVTSELTSLSSALSGTDKNKIEAHLTQIRQIETQLQVGMPMNACVKPPAPAIMASAPIVYNASGMETKQDPSADNDVPMRHDLVRKMLLAAMACDMSRVGTIMMAPSRSDIFLTWIAGGVTQSHHDYSHHGDTDTTAQQRLVAINQWYGKQVAEMITLLKGTKEGAGTMWDNTVLLWCNELGIGNAHTHTQIPLMLAGSAGGYFKTGQAVKMPSGTPHNRLLLSLIQGMGISNVTSFGNAKFCTDGPIKEILRVMPTSIKPFEPKYMKLGVLTAALQELTPRAVRDEDPDRAIEDWLAFAREIGADNIQLSAALHPTESDVPPEAMLDPVANTLDLRKPFDATRAKRVLAAVKEAKVGISDFAYFDNLLHHDAGLRKKKHDFMLRVFDTAALLGVDAVCGFVGRNQTLSMDQNLEQFAHDFIPLLKAAKARGLTYRVEQCPMPGWTTGDNWHNNVAYTPGAWIALHKICEKHGVGDQLRIHYDPSHAILMGQDTRSLFQYLKDEGYAFLIGGFHVKGQVIDSKGVSAWGYGGQTMGRGDWPSGKLSEKPADHVHAWLKQTAFSEHELPGTARHDPLAYLQNRSVDWLDHQLAARELLPLDVAKTHLIVEHEYPRARIQDKARLAPILAGSLAFTRKIDEAAACMYALQHEVLASQDIPVQGHGRAPYRS